MRCKNEKGIIAFMKYSQVVVGGTFDLLHIGHRKMLAKAFELGRFVTIGITTDQFNQKRSKPSIQNQSHRMDSLKNFLKEKRLLKRSRVLWIADQYGTTLTDPTVEAIIVSRSTSKVARLINQKRTKLGLKKLDIVIFPYIKDGTGRIISSSRIRQGGINTSGQSYQDLLLKVAGKKLSANIRTKLKKPLGHLTSISSLTPPTSLTITIGDVTTANFLKANLQPNLAIIDGKVGRQPSIDPNFHQDDQMVKNSAGQISRSLILAIARVLKDSSPITHYSSLFIDGEEDLATIPAILLAPLGTTVYYGQPKKGIVEVKVDLKIKDYLCTVLKLN